MLTHFNKIVFKLLLYYNMYTFLKLFFNSYVSCQIKITICERQDKQFPFMEIIIFHLWRKFRFISVYYIHLQQNKFFINYYLQKWQSTKNQVYFKLL